MTNDEARLETEKFLMNTYARQPVAFVKGHGLALTDTEGKEYQDFLAGLAVASLGHCHPSVVEAVRAQAGELIHTSNLYHIPNQSKLARYLVDVSFAQKVFFCNSGAEANEGAVKLARRYHAKVAGTGRPTVLTFENSFHGRTLAMLSATGQAKYRDGFDPLPAGFVQVPYNDLAAVRAALDADPSIGAVMLEIIQAEGGVIPATREFLAGVRQITAERGILLIYDEVQTGMGRTGKFFAYEESGIAPDIMTLAKGLAGGVPIGALLATDAVAAAFTPGSHASTFGGNPLATAAAIAVFKAMLNDQLVDRAAASGKFIVEKLKKEPRPSIVDIRGRGLLIGIELNRPAAPVVKEMLGHGYIIGSAGENVLRLAPPLIVSQGQCGKMVETLLQVLV